MGITKIIYTELNYIYQLKISIKLQMKRHLEENIKKTDKNSQLGGAGTPCKSKKKGPQVANTSEGWTVTMV